MFYTPFGYVGSKFRQLNNIVPILNSIQHNVYVEPFGGSSVVLLNKNQIRSEIYNDSNNLLCNFFKVLRDKDLVSQLEYLICATPVQRNIYNDLKKLILSYKTDDYHKLKKYNKLDKYQDDVVIAYCVFYLQNIAFGGKWLDSFGGGKISDKRSPVMLLNGKTNNLWKYVQRFKNVLVENLDYKDCIKKYDDYDVLFYLDPPYDNTDISNKYKDGTIDSQELVDILKDVKAQFVLSCYDNNTYQQLLKCGFKRRQFSALCSVRNDLRGERMSRIETVYIKRKGLLWD